MKGIKKQKMKKKYMNTNETQNCRRKNIIKHQTNIKKVNKYKYNKRMKVKKIMEWKKI